METSETETNKTWGSVNERYDRAVVVASGPSARAIDWRTVRLPAEIALITVNKALLHVGHPTHWITVDPSADNRELMRHQRLGVRYYAAVPPDFGGPKARHRWWKSPSEPNVTYLKQVRGKGRFRAMKGLSEDSGAIHVGNSGYGALGLAYLMRAKHIALFGVDGHGGYWFGPGGPQGSLEMLPDLFASAVDQLSKHAVQVVNASPDSTIRCFPTMAPQEALAWIQQ